MSPKIQFSIFVLIAFVIGFFIRPHLYSPVVPERDGLTQADGRSESQKTDDFLSDEQRNQSANEELSRLIKLFMVDVALRLSDENKKGLSKLSSITECGTPSSPETSTQNLNIHDKNQHRSQPQQVNNNESSLLEKVIRVERQKRDLRNDSDENKFIDDIKIENLEPILKQRQSLDANGATRLTGTFKGTITFFDTSKESWDVTLEFLPEPSNDNKIHANTTLIFSKNGVDFSTSRGSGYDDKYSYLGGGSQALLIESGGKT
ncbi:MAG: hypothetical protein KDD34_00265, partial [Bdellovibrionales bacterium]|nr:hypothetical protein [Bdellovibrionales bacterium]